ncbi:cytochrome c [Bradyrhizobium sp.]|uniref:c-type cytochrome n=1 Tax=Bradyrhizobium sp. TaxID=376 RepID=UPI001D8FE8D0|nr:cytochrome c [Bradyrhizobium sp.]MBI5322996.1 cytochrome c [Bradyrhizobium sp.]
MSRRTWIRILIGLAIALAALLLVRLHNAGGATPEQDGVSAGRRLAEAWCRECHAFELSDGSGRAPDLVRIANRTSTTELSLKVFLRTNHRSMPNLIIAPDQADILAQFILSLKQDR